METYYGHVRTPADAIILFEACRLGLLPRVQRRLSEKERQSIRSGSVFVWDEREAGMRRWTDGKSWSASRVSGSFLTYREMEGKRGGGHVSSHSTSRVKEIHDSSKGSDDDHDHHGEEGPDGYRYKPDGLMKQSFSITTSTGQHLHLISYYSRAHPNAPGLNNPSTDPQLRHIRPQKGLYPESSINDQQNLPVVTRGPMAGATYPVQPPPMAPYHRPPTGHPHGYSHPYGWPAAAPMPGPEPHVHIMPYAAGYLPPPMAVQGHPPAPYPHPPPYLPHHVVPCDKYPHHPETPLPPPVQSAHHPHGIPHYSPNRSPRLTHALPAHSNGIPPTSHVPVPHPGPIDPRGIHAHADNDENRPPNGVRTEHLPSLQHHLTRPSSAEKRPTRNGSRDGSDRSSSTTHVPSINELVNATPAPSNGPQPCLSDIHRSKDHQHNGVEVNGGSQPGQPVSTADGPQDIPSEKMGFGEDARALRQLDRVFSA